MVSYVLTRNKELAFPSMRTFPSIKYEYTIWIYNMNIQYEFTMISWLAWPTWFTDNRTLKHTLECYKKHDTMFSKLMFHMQKYTGGAVKTWHVHALNVNCTTVCLDKLECFKRGTMWKKVGHSGQIENGSNQVPVVRRPDDTTCIHWINP